MLTLWLPNGEELFKHLPPPRLVMGKWQSSGKMTLNASWIERLTLRDQVIRETKGQAKQQQKTPNYSYRTPFPRVKEELHVAWPCPTNTSQESLHASALTERQSRTRHSKVGGEWGKWINLEWKKWTGLFAFGCCSAEVIWMTEGVLKTDNSPTQTSSAAFWEKLTVITSHMLTMFADDLETWRGPEGQLRRRGGVFYRKGEGVKFVCISRW